jgi:EAL domain-containing protein (putative c-di-GMP-specific phosphodiesterase class I)
LLGATASKPLAQPHANQALNESALTEALQNHWIQPFFQPKITCDTGDLCGFEVLARLHHPELGLVSPDAFIPLGEASGLVTPLTLQILESSLSWISQLSNQDIGLAVNLSRSSTDTGFADQLMKLCQKCGIKPGRLTLEITETAQHNNPRQLLEFLTRFRIQGFKLALDDFGVGYSSLTELTRLPFSEIKIDKSFVCDVTQSLESQKICSAIVGLGKAMGLEITAEGVENAQALAFLADINCDKAQGYYIARPMPANQATQWMDQYQASREGA